MIGIARQAPWFRPGEVVRHVRYGYRGVIVAVDERCEAPEAWYRANQTQPNRQQPWYHVLVDGGPNVTYAAQTSLAIDPQPGPISHPLVAVFFHTFTGVRYERNEVAWPDET